MKNKLRILLTNDDSINSSGIILLADALRNAGHRVFVLAPETDQSGVSHFISFFRTPRKIMQTGPDTWVCDGTPADCVAVALLGGLPEMCKSLDDTPPDLVIAGINRGENLGTDLTYSGTAAAARQGALCGIPSLALSLHEGDEGRQNIWNWEMAAAFSVERLDEMINCWKPGSFVNVNIPNHSEKPLKIVHAFPSFRYYNDSIEIYNGPDGHRYCFTRTGKISEKSTQEIAKLCSVDFQSGDLLSDYDVVTGNNASLSRIYIHPVLLESMLQKH